MQEQLTSWMGLMVGFGEVFQRKMGVNLGGRRGGVPKEFLDGAQIGAMGEQMGGEGVAQFMGREVGGESCLREPMLHKTFNGARG